MKAYSLKWWFETGRKFKREDVKAGRIVKRKRFAAKRMSNIAFKIGYWAA